MIKYQEDHLLLFIRLDSRPQALQRGSATSAFVRRQ